MPPIKTNKNQNFGNNLGTQKYSPLLDPQYEAGDQNYYSALLTNRWNLLSAANLLPQPLALATPNWAAITAAEAGKNPPLVVISSNRSKWIKAGIEAADTQLENLPGSLANFTNAGDLRALTASVGQKTSPPIYCPKRIDPALNRNVYIVVHFLEYNDYKTELAGTGITVVGWLFRPPTPSPGGGVRVTGWGASRYAAIEFCKYLRTAAANPWDYAWLLDDNVVALASFTGYKSVEDEMTGNDVCACFEGGTKALTKAENCEWAKREIQAGRGKQEDKSKLVKSKDKALIQQAALWNIDYLTRNNLNFAPVYISSGEDLSFSNYFDNRGIKYRNYSGITVRKELATDDGSDSAQKLKAARTACTALFSNAEGAGAPGRLPPPVEVQPTDTTDGGVQTLANFIVTRVLPNSALAAKANDVDTQNETKSRAVEQITCGAIKAGFVSPAALDTTFKINGTAPQAIVQRDVP